MIYRVSFAALVFATSVFVASAEPVKSLPGEDGRIPALSPDPFPDRLSAYVWRNWGLVETERLEAVVGAPRGALAGPVPCLRSMATPRQDR